MEAIVKKVLDTSRIYKGEPIVAVTNDKNSRFIQAVICTDGVPNYVGSSEAVIVTYERADGTSKTYNGTSNADGSVKVPIASWATEEEGDVYGWITVGTGADALSTTKFVIEVQYRPDTGGEVSEDDPEYDDIMNILAKLNEHTQKLDVHTAKIEEHTQKLDLYQKHISENAKDVSAVSNVASANRKRIANIEVRLGQSASVTDDTIAYAKIVPEGALPYAEVTKIGGMSYRDEATNTIKHGAVTGIKATGVNLLKVNPINVSQNGVTIVSNGDGSVTVNGTPTQEFVVYIGLLNFKYIYGVFTARGGNEFFYQLYDKNGNYVKDIMWGNGSFRILESEKDYSAIQAFIHIYADAKYSNAKLYPMVNIGGSALPYEAYKEATLPIPANVQSLNGYGQGVNGTYYNYIEWKNGIKTFNQYVAKTIVNGTYAPVMQVGANGDKYAVFGYINDADMVYKDSSRLYPSVCNKYPIVTAEQNYDGSATGVGINHMCAITAYDKNLQTAEAWQAKLQEWNDAGTPFELIYAKKDPIVTDISDLLSDDNFIEVSEGGLVIAENADCLGVPTTITYQIKEDAE
jgi:hypothetical protein